MLRFYAFERVEILRKKLNENGHPKLINITVNLLITGPSPLPNFEIIFLTVKYFYLQFVVSHN